METHNHAPCVGIVEGCDYCKTHGNVFQNGPIQFHEELNVPFVYALRNKQREIPHVNENDETNQIQITS